MAVAGYNIAFTLSPGHLTIAGRTQDDLTIAARTQERLTKDDQGEAQVAVIGQDITFRATGLVVITGQGLDRDWLISAANSSNTLDFTYLCSGGGTLSGNCIMTNYSESSNASDDATWTADFRVVGTPTFVPAPEDDD